MNVCETITVNINLLNFSYSFYLVVQLNRDHGRDSGGICSITINLTSENSDYMMFYKRVCEKIKPLCYGSLH